MSSILTNNNAMAALSTLRSISSGMEETQNRISSGLKVGTAADNAAYWSIATTMRSDNAALGSVQDAMGLGAAKIDTAYAGMEAAIDVVTEIKNKLVTAQESSADKSKIQEEIKQLQDQLKSISSSATFSGENFLQADVSNAANNEIVKSVVGSFTRDAGGNVKVQTVDYKLNASTVLFDTGAADGAGKGILDATLKLDEKRSTVEVTVNKPVTVTGDDLVKGGSEFTAATGTAAEFYETDSGDRYVRYNNEDGQVRDASGKDLWVKVVPAAAAPAAPNNQTAKAADGTTALTNGTNPYYVVTEPVVEEHNVAATTRAALEAAGSKFVPADATDYDDATGDFANLTTAEQAIVTAKGFSKIEINDDGIATIYSDYKDDGTGTFEAGTTETYIKLGTSDTWVKAEVHTTATNEYQDGVKGVKVGTDYYAIDTDNTKINSAFGKVETDVGVSVSDLDITKLGELAEKLGVSEEDVLDKLVQHVDDQLGAMTSAASQLGSLSSRIDMQQEFVSKLSDTLDSGIGRLVDADMNEESTRLKALQTQQQLAIQALSIANSDSQNILSLFR